ncbi:hypothetical protein GY45DRAFT_1433330 [Cubamyces sp. BRFM 1775]|nr:hypothetical protein GY45DRAFT_1433330 [Cubamyces sp. BRFM 1775]
MRTFTILSSLAAIMTTAVYASPEGLKNRQLPDQGALGQCLNGCVARFNVDCSVNSTGGDSSQCLCDPATRAAITFCLSQACNNVAGAPQFAELYQTLCGTTPNLPRDDTSGDSAASASAGDDPLSGLLGSLTGILGGGL